MQTKIERFLNRKNYQPLIADTKFFLNFDSRFLVEGSNRQSVDRLNAIFEDMVRTRGYTVLDIGCNIGFFCHALQSRGYECTGVDNDEHSRAHKMPSVIDQAKELNLIYNLRPDFIKRDYFGKWNKKFDFVLLLSTFHHLFVKETAEHCEQVLKQIFEMTNSTLYFEMDLEIEAVKKTGLNENNLTEFLEKTLGTKPKFLLLCKDAQPKPRMLFAIDKI